VRATLACAPASLDPLLRRLLERALGVGRALRGRAGLARASRSVGSLAVDEVARLVGDPARSTVLVVGAGEMGKLAVRALSRRFGRVLVANRDRARAEALAASSGATAIGLDEIAAHLDGVGAIVSAADTRGAVLTRDLLAPRVAREPLALIDIAVPRSVAADARDLDGLAYRSVDDLGAAVALTSSEAARARAACAAAADEFAREAGERSAARAIGDLRAHADALRAHQLERALRRLSHLSARDRRVVEALAARVTNSLLHAPTVALRRSPERSDDTLALFGVGRGER
jgi:glutamyl-tRNA reductase